MTTSLERFQAGRNVYPESIDKATLLAFTEALYKSFGVDTLREEDRATWDPDDPSNNQCVCAAIVTAVFFDQFGYGKIASNRQIDHYWGTNNEADEAIDFTRNQKSLSEVPDESFVPEKVRPPLELLVGENAERAKTAERFAILLTRVETNLLQDSPEIAAELLTNRPQWATEVLEKQHSKGDRLPD